MFKKPISKPHKEVFSKRKIVTKKIFEKVEAVNTQLLVGYVQNLKNSLEFILPFIDVDNKTQMVEKDNIITNLAMLDHYLGADSENMSIKLTGDHGEFRSIHICSPDGSKVEAIIHMNLDFMKVLGFDKSLAIIQAFDESITHIENEFEAPSVHASDEEKLANDDLTEVDEDDDEICTQMLEEESRSTPQFRKTTSTYTKH